MVLEGLIQNLRSKLEAAGHGATALQLDVGVVRAVVDGLTESDGLRAALEQAQEQLSLKPSVAKKLADKIKQLEADLDVLRSNSRVTELEKKLQILQAELKQSYATKNFALKSGLLDVEKRYRDLIYGGSEALQDLWSDITWLLTEDKESLPAEVKARRALRAINELGHKQDSYHAPSPSPAVEDLGVHQQAARHQDAPLPELASTSSSVPPRLRSITSFSGSQPGGRRFSDAGSVQSSSSASFGDAGLAAAMREAYNIGGGGAVLPGSAGSTQAMLRPVSLHHEVTGPVDASALREQAHSMFASLTQLRRHFQGYSHHPTHDHQQPPASVGASAHDGAAGAAAFPVDATSFAGQAEQLRQSVLHLRSVYAGGTAPLGPPGATGDAAIRTSGTGPLTPGAHNFEAQANEALASIDHLQRMYQQYASAALAAPTPASGRAADGGAPTARHDPVPDARYFDERIQRLAASLQQMQGMLPTGSAQLSLSEAAALARFGQHGVGATVTDAPCVDTSMLHERAKDVFATLLQLRSSCEVAHDRSSQVQSQHQHQPGLCSLNGSLVIDSRSFDQQAEDLRASVLELRAQFAAAYDATPPASAAVPQQLPPADAHRFNAQSETALATLEQLQRIYASAAGSPGDTTPTRASGDGTSGQLEPQLLDQQMQLLATSLQQMRLLLPGGIQSAAPGLAEGVLTALSSLFMHALNANGQYNPAALTAQDGARDAVPPPVEELSQRFARFLQAATSHGAGGGSAGGFSAEQVGDARRLLARVGLVGATGAELPIHSMTTIFARVVSELGAQGKLPPAGGGASTGHTAGDEVAGLFAEGLQALQAASPSLVSEQLAVLGAAMTWAEPGAGGAPVPVPGTLADGAGGAALDRLTGGSSASLKQGAGVAAVPAAAAAPLGLGWPYSNVGFQAAAVTPRVLLNDALPDFGTSGGAEGAAATPAAAASAAAVAASAAAQQQQRLLVSAALQRVAATHELLLASHEGAAALWRDVQAALLEQPTGAAPAAGVGAALSQALAPTLPAGSPYAALSGGLGLYSGAGLSAAAPASRASGLVEITPAVDQPSPAPASSPSGGAQQDETDPASMRKVKADLTEKVLAYAQTIRQLSSKLEVAITRADEAEFLMMQKGLDLRRAESNLERLQQESMGWRLELIDAKIRMAEKGEEQARMVKKIAQSSGEQKVLIEIQEDLRTLIKGASLPAEDALMQGLLRIMKRVRAASSGGGLPTSMSMSDEQAAGLDVSSGDAGVAPSTTPPYLRTASMGMVAPTNASGAGAAATAAPMMNTPPTSRLGRSATFSPGTGAPAAAATGSAGRMSASGFRGFGLGSRGKPLALAGLPSTPSSRGTSRERLDDINLNE